MTLSVRPVGPQDLEALTTIYNWYVEHSHATLDVEPVTREVHARWLAGFAASGPHQAVVAEVDDRVAGYAASVPYRTHPAFAETVETTVYVHPQQVGHGLGGSLYDALFNRLRGAQVHRALAGVALPNDASVALHRSRGFREVGTFTAYAHKRGQRISSMWFERPVRDAVAVSR